MSEQLTVPSDSNDGHQNPEENTNNHTGTHAVGYQTSGSGEAVSLQINEDSNDQQNLNNDESNRNNMLSSTRIKENILSTKDFFSGMLSYKLTSFRKKNSVQHLENSNIGSAEESTSLIKKNCGVSGYIAPLPKCDWSSIDVPKHLGGMYDDVFRYIFMFMTPKELIIFGGVSRRFREMSVTDEVWSPIYQSYTFSSVEKDTTVTQNFRHEFLKKLKENSTLEFLREESKQNVPILEQVQACCQCGYGFMAPQIFFTSFTVFSILVPLLMDGYIDISQVGFCSLPFFFALGTYLFISVSLLIDPYSLDKKRSKYLKYLQPQSLDTGFYNDRWALMGSESTEESDFDDG